VWIRGQARGRHLSVESLVQDEGATATPVPADAALTLNLRRAVVLMVDLTNAKASYSYRVSAIDTAGNVSAASAPIAVTAGSTTTPGKKK
jgi:hypothetical protein